MRRCGYFNNEEDRCTTDLIGELMGADRVLSKPIDFLMLQATLKEVLKTV